MAAQVPGTGDRFAACTDFADQVPGAYGCSHRPEMVHARALCVKTAGFPSKRLAHQVVRDPVNRSVGRRRTRKTQNSSQNPADETGKRTRATAGAPKKAAALAGQDGLDEVVLGE